MENKPHDTLKLLSVVLLFGILLSSFGSAATAGNTAATNLEGLVSSATSAFGTASLTFVGQNLGAGKDARVKHSFALCFALGTLAGLVLGLSCFSFGESLLTLFVGNDPAAIEYGMIRAQYILAFYFIAGMNSCFSSTLQAFGYSTFVSLNSILTVFGFRLLWMNTIYHLAPTYRCIFLCFLVSWLLLLLCNVVMMAIVFRKYKKGTLHALS
jgi:Na+-driven multidrug efflux pump